MYALLVVIFLKLISTPLCAMNVQEIHADICYINDIGALSIPKSTF